MARKTFDIDTLINIFDELSKKPFEMGEQDDAGGDTGGGGGKSPTKHFDLYKPNRGPANQIGNTKWSDIVKLTRGKANPIDTKSKWDSGVKRGKGNTLI